MAHKDNDALMTSRFNTARFFVTQRQVAWAVLILVIVWGIYGIFSMPQRKDPEVQTRIALAACIWPGATAAQVEQLITRPIEEAVSQNQNIHAPSPDVFALRSISLPGVSYVYIELAENAQSREQYNDIDLRLRALSDRLPRDVHPVQFYSDFSDTATLMLTVASPPIDDVEMEMRSRAIQKSIRSSRADSVMSQRTRVSIIHAFPLSFSKGSSHRAAELLRGEAEKGGFFQDVRIVSGPGFAGIDGATSAGRQGLERFIASYTELCKNRIESDPDMWPPVIIDNPDGTKAALASVAGWKYTYAELDNCTDLLARTLLGVPQASRVERKGVLPRTIYLTYSQQRLVSMGFQPADLSRVLGARNITMPAGTMETGGSSIILNATGSFDSVAAIGGVVVGTSREGVPVYLRDLVDIASEYENPARYLNYYTWTDSSGKTHRSRAVTIALYMRQGEQIAKFGKEVDKKLEEVRGLIPPDLIIARTSDQPQQVKESVDLFTKALYEAIILIIIISFIGFWEWRSALLMAVSIPITLAMTAGLASLVHIDIQQVSIAALIIALGLLVDDPVVANDAIKRELSAGVSRLDASWLGPTKLARAILYATVTNIVAYLPFLLVSGRTGEFLYSLPIVMTAALVSSRIVSMTFIPLLAYYLLKPDKKSPQSSTAGAPNHGFPGLYYRLTGLIIRVRWAVLGGSLAFLILGLLAGWGLRTQFFADDVQYWSYVDVWLPNDAPLSLTNQLTGQAERVIQRVAAEHEKKDFPEGRLLQSLTTFVGGGGPRFWFTVSPEPQQPNYAQIIIRLNDKEATPKIAAALQRALTADIPGAFATVRQLQINPVSYPLEVRIYSTSSGTNGQEDPSGYRTLRRLSGTIQDILRSTPGIAVVRDDWLSEGLDVRLTIDPDRANAAGITNFDVASSTMAETSGMPVAMIQQGNRQVPMVARLRPDERARLSDVKDLYVYSSQGPQKIPLSAVSSILPVLETRRIGRQNHFRMIGIHGFPQPGVLSSVILNKAMPRLMALGRSLPPGYRMEIGGEKAAQDKGFSEISLVLIISVIAIYVALFLQFRHAVKPLLVLATAPYGVAGALIALWIMGAPFGFMAFLGVASLIGVIVSHVIVLFDLVEVMRERGEDIQEALRNAGIQRLRPVLITVGATVFALFPLAKNGGPLWQPLCYAQIGGLSVATFITLLLVPVLYSIAVLDLKIVKWETPEDTNDPVKINKIDETGRPM